jgi:predicted small secreted protein
MKTLFVIVLSVMLTACSTLGGAVSGAGEDLSKVGEWIKSK